MPSGTLEGIDGCGELAKALAAVQSELKIAIKDKSNPFFKSKYADLQTVWDTCRGLLARNGLAVLQLPGGDADTVRVTTMLMHSSGQWVSDDGLAMKPVKTDPQGVASCITYARRYGLMAVLGIVSDEDDDGEAATGRAKAGKIEDDKPKSFRPRIAPTEKPAKDQTIEVQASLASVDLVADLTTIKMRGGWTHKFHRDNWKLKHKKEIDALPLDDQMDLTKVYNDVPMKEQQ